MLQQCNILEKEKKNCEERGKKISHCERLTVEKKKEGVNRWINRGLIINLNRREGLIGGIF